MNGKHTILIAWSFVSNGRDRHFSNNTMHLITTVTDNTEKSMVVLHCNEKGSVKNNYIEGGGLQDKLDNASSKLIGDQLKLSSEELSITSDRHSRNIFV